MLSVKIPSGASASMESIGGIGDRTDGSMSVYQSIGQIIGCIGVGSIGEAIDGRFIGRADRTFIGATGIGAFDLKTIGERFIGKIEPMPDEKSIGENPIGPSAPTSR